METGLVEADLQGPTGTAGERVEGAEAAQLGLDHMAVCLAEKTVERTPAQVQAVHSHLSHPTPAHASAHCGFLAVLLE